MRDVVYAHIRPDEDSGFVAVCDQLHAATQGSTLDAMVANLREAVGWRLTTICQTTAAGVGRS